jgi:hypothetical protein
MQNRVSPEMIKGLVASNCMELLSYLSEDDIIVTIMIDDYNRDVMIIKIPLLVDESSQVEKDIYYAFYRNELNELEFNFLVDDDR